MLYANSLFFFFFIWSLFQYEVVIRVDVFTSAPADEKRDEEKSTLMSDV